MASGKKKNSSGRKNSSKKGNSKQKKKEMQVQSFTEEIILWIVLAVSILLFLSNFGIGGTVGNAVSGFFFGIFGLIAYAFPIVFVVGTFFAASNKGNRIAAVKITAACCFVLFLCMFIELVLNGKAVIGAAAAYRYSSLHKNGGGFFGGFLAALFCNAFGLVGAYVVDIIAMIIFLVLITEHSAMREVKKGGQKVYETAKEGNERYKEYAGQKREERKLRRMDKKVEGVAIDTAVVSNKQKLKKSNMPDEVSEIDIEALLHWQEESPKNAVERVTLTSKNQSIFETLPKEEPEKMEKISIAPSKGQTPKTQAAEKIEEIEEIKSSEIQKTDKMIEIQKPVEIQKPIEIEKPTEIQKQKSVELAKAAQTQKPIEEESKIQQEENCESVSETYCFPPIELLNEPKQSGRDSNQYLEETALKLQQTLKNFGVNVTITHVSCGPAVTRYELQPEMGVKVSKIVNLADDIKLNLAAADIRIEAPIPGKAAIGIEVPNKETQMVSFRELVASEEFRNHKSKVSFCVGKDISGKVMVADIASMPHLLIAGATGSGKSVCINTIIMSILYKADPKDVKLLMIDPKVVELSVYNGIEHLLVPVVTDPKKAAGVLQWAVTEMLERYDKFAEVSVREIKGYNEKIEELPEIEGQKKPEKMPQIVIIVDELADLMMAAPGDVEESICRLTQLARACGIHLIIATQRPSVNVITGLIKANMPSRIAFAVTSGVDSRTILDMNGAEKLLGKGDMLFNPQGVPKPLRVQGAFISDKEVSKVVSFLKERNGKAAYSKSVEERLNNLETANTTAAMDSRQSNDGRDTYFTDAAKLLIDKEKGSIGMLQRYFKVGYNRAARIMDQLEEAGIVGPEEGTKPRKVLMSLEQFEQFQEECL